MFDVNRLKAVFLDEMDYLTSKINACMFNRIFVNCMFDYRERSNRALRNETLCLVNAACKDVYIADDDDFRIFSDVVQFLHFVDDGCFMGLGLRLDAGDRVGEDGMWRVVRADDCIVDVSPFAFTLPVTIGSVVAVTIHSIMLAADVNVKAIRSNRIKERSLHDVFGGYYE